MSEGPKPYQMVYDAENGPQYAFETGYINIPLGPPTTPAGESTQIQFNDSGEFGASANLTYVDTTLTLGDVSFAYSAGGELDINVDHASGVIDLLTNGTGSGLFIADNGSETQVAIGGTGTPAASAVLTLASTTLGLLLPRMTNTQRDAIATPAEGLMIYSLSDHALEFYDGSAWQQVAIVA